MKYKDLNLDLPRLPLENGKEGSTQTYEETRKEFN
jgi:hypothetical protein